MSAHTRVRKVFSPADGSHVELTITIHNVDPTPADLIVSAIVRAASGAVDDYRDQINDRVRQESVDRAARVAALIKQHDPDNKVISHGSAELHNLPAEPAAKAEAKPAAKPGKQKQMTIKGEAARG